jgi:hypothetical protein
MTLFLAGFLLPGLALADYLDETDTFHERLALDGPVRLDVDTGSGSIQVRAGSGREASITGTIRVNRRSFWRKTVDAEEVFREIRENPPLSLTRSRLKVGYFSDRSLGKQVSISYDIVVPADTEVVADSGSGSITITNIAAPVNADTGSGSVTLENIGASVKADTGSGSVRADGVAGEFEADTGSGSVYLLQTAPGDVWVSTGSGSSELRGVVGAVRVDSGSGRITVEGLQDGSWKLDSGSGAVRVDLPDDAAFFVDAQSNSGGITVDHPLDDDAKLGKKHVKGGVRGGGPLLHIDTGSGSIRVE